VDSLHIERAGIWLFVNEDQALRCVNLFERSVRKHTKGACLGLSECPAFQRAIASSPLLPCESARTDPRTAELSGKYFAPLGIASTLNAPLHRDGKLTGVLLCEHVGSPRSWSDADRAFALALAEYVVHRMKTAEGALKTAAPRTHHVVIPAPARLQHELKDLVAEIEMLARSEARSGTAERFRRIENAAARASGILRKLFDAPTETSEHDTVREDGLDDDTGEHTALPADASRRT
jgi:hypothetical protein